MIGKLPEVSWSARDAVKVYLLAWLGLPFLILIAIQELAPTSQLINDFFLSISSGDIAANFALNLINALAALGLVWYFLRRHKAKWHELGLRRFNVLKALGYVVLLLLAFGLIVAGIFALVQMLLPGFDPNQQQTNEFTNATGSQARQLSLLALVIIPPFIEEIVFRGFVFPAFGKRWGLWFGAILTSLLFGLAHFQANVGIYTFVLSLLLCIMYYRLGSIWPGIVLHMLNNYLAFIAIMK